MFCSATLLVVNKVAVTTIPSVPSPFIEWLFVILFWLHLFSDLFGKLANDDRHYSAGFFRWRHLIWVTAPLLLFLVYNVGVRLYLGLGLGLVRVRPYLWNVVRPYH